MGNQRPRKQTPDGERKPAAVEASVCWAPRPGPCPPTGAWAGCLRLTGEAAEAGRGEGTCRVPQQWVSGPAGGRALLSDRVLCACSLPHCPWATKPSRNTGKSGPAGWLRTSEGPGGDREYLSCYRPLRRAGRAHGHRLHGGRLQLRIRKNFLEKQPLYSGLKGGPKRYVCILIHENQECDLIWKKSLQLRLRTLT